MRNIEIKDLPQFKTYALIEFTLLKKEWRWILFGAIIQYVHGVAHNLAYYLQKRLSVEQKFPLYDLGYELLPQIKTPYSNISEYFVFFCFFGISGVLLLSIPLLKMDPNKPRFIVIIIKRILMNLAFCQILRMLSFLCTSLPGAAPHCTVVFNETCLESNPSVRADCVVDNPDFRPPVTAVDFLFHFDTINGCGDLMFSSHTIFTVTFILMTWKYWFNKYLIGFLLAVQIATAFIIVASRKHYTLDVLTAIYVVPMVWLLLDAYFDDINSRNYGLTASNIKEMYGIDLYDEVNPVSVDNQTVFSSPTAFNGTPYNVLDSRQMSTELSTMNGQKNSDAE